MKKSILNLSGAQELSKNEQKAVSGGKKECRGYISMEGWVPGTCPTGTCCVNYVCVRCKFLEL